MAGENMAGENMAEKGENMAKILIKLYDNEIDFEEFIIVDEEDIDEVLELLNDYRKSEPEYNIDGFLELLDENEIQYEYPSVEKVYF